MAATPLQRDAYIVAVRDAVTRMYKANSDIQNLVTEGNDRGLLSGPGMLVASDFRNDNALIDVTEFFSAGTTASTVINATNRAILSKIKF